MNQKNRPSDHFHLSICIVLTLTALPGSNDPIFFKHAFVNMLAPKSALTLTARPIVQQDVAKDLAWILDHWPLIDEQASVLSPHKLADLWSGIAVLLSAADRAAEAQEFFIRAEQQINELHHMTDLTDPDVTPVKELVRAYQSASRDYSNLGLNLAKAGFHTQAQMQFDRATAYTSLIPLDRVEDRAATLDRIIDDQIAAKYLSPTMKTAGLLERTDQPQAYAKIAIALTQNGRRPDALNLLGAVIQVTKDAETAAYWIAHALCQIAQSEIKDTPSLAVMTFKSALHYVDQIRDTPVDRVGALAKVLGSLDGLQNITEPASLQSEVQSLIDSTLADTLKTAEQSLTGDDVYQKTWRSIMWDEAITGLASVGRFQEALVLANFYQRNEVSTGKKRNDTLRKIVYHMGLRGTLEVDGQAVNLIAVARFLIDGETTLGSLSDPEFKFLGETKKKLLSLSKSHIKHEEHGSHARQIIQVEERNILGAGQQLDADKIRRVAAGNLGFVFSAKENISEVRDIARADLVRGLSEGAQLDRLKQGGDFLTPTMLARAYMTAGRFSLMRGDTEKGKRFFRRAFGAISNFGAKDQFEMMAEMIQQLAATGLLSDALKLALPTSDQPVGELVAVSLGEARAFSLAQFPHEDSADPEDLKLAESRRQAVWNSILQHFTLPIEAPRSGNLLDIRTDIVSMLNLIPVRSNLDTLIAMEQEPQAI